MALSSSVRDATSHSASAIVADTVEGSLVLKIHGYSMTKGLGSGEYINSGTFDVGGHGWSIRYYPDGEDPKHAGWISFFLDLKNSSATEVEARFMFSLLDEMGEPVPSYRKGWSPIHTFNIEQDQSCGYDGFIERKTLEESSYLKDDCFRVRCDVIVSKGFRTDTKQFVTVPPPDMDQHIGRLLSASQVEADVTFQVGMETFTAHRLVLAARSPVFMAELFGPLKQNTMHHIRIDDMEPQVFKAMLHFIYTDSLADVVEKDEALVMAQHLLIAADRYDLERLKLMCEDKLCNYGDTSTVTANLALAEQHGCRGLKEACFEFLNMSGNLKAIMLSDDFEHLTSSYPSLLKELVVKFAP